MPIGIDIEEHSRFDLSNNKLINKILSNDEFRIFSLFGSEKRKIEYLCSRWAAKEAIFKLNKFDSKNYHDYSILNDDFGKPEVYVYGKKIQIDISISHSDNYSICVVFTN